MSDETPSGEPIETFTLWLDFPEGEVALSLDLTKFNAAMRGLRSVDACPCGGSGKGGDGCSCDPPFGRTK